VKIRVLTNQIIKINYDYQNLYEKKVEIKSNMKEINFFGLLLRVSKDFLTPNHNVILHIPGGGFLSQSSESHLSYLTKWAKLTDSVIISIDYKLSNDNKYPVLMDECLKIYEMLIKFTPKLFNFNISKLLIYSDTLGSLIAVDIIKFAIKHSLKIPDASVYIYPCPRMIFDEEQLEKYEFLSLLEKEDNFDTPVMAKISEIFLDGCSHDQHIHNDRLNFLLTEPAIVTQFPPCLILSASNEPIRENCVNFTEYLINSKVNVTFKQMLHYCSGCFQVPSLFDCQYDKVIDYTLDYIVNIFKNKDDYKELYSSEKSSVGFNSNSTETSSFN